MNNIQYYNEAKTDYSNIIWTIFNYYIKIQIFSIKCFVFFTWYYNITETFPVEARIISTAIFPINIKNQN